MIEKYQNFMGTETVQVANGDVPFRHYTFKHRVVAWISVNLFDGFVYTVNHGLNRGMKRKGGLGWLPESLSGSIHTPEHEFWTKLNLKDAVIYDVGAFQGLLTLFFASRGKQVISFEPNSKNNARLTENILLNQLNNVLIRKVGLGSHSGSATMVASPLMPGGASIETSTVEGLQNSNMQAQTESITVTTIDQDIQEHSLPAPDFIKVDVEGLELPVLQGARETLVQYKPRLFLEMHGETLNLKRQNVAAIVRYLLDIGYGSILHVETGTRLGVENSAVAAEGHLYCQWQK